MFKMLRNKMLPDPKIKKPHATSKVILIFISISLHKLGVNWLMQKILAWINTGTDYFPSISRCSLP